MLSEIKIDNIVPIEIAMEVKVGELPTLILDTEYNSVKVTGEDVVEASINTIMSEEKLHKSINKMGDTPYYIINSTFEFDEKSFMPQKTINKLRRDAIDRLDSLRENINDREYNDNEYSKVDNNYEAIDCRN